jgi:OFA family oxalate/formate antiporter-like MFS transporter
MRRYIILIAAVMMMLSLGTNYAWSTFVPVLKMKYHLSTAQTQAIFGTSGLMFTIFAMIGGRLQDRIGPRVPAFFGGVIFGVSYILAGYSSGSYASLQTFIGVTGGMGVGLCYLCPLICMIKWFPHQKSLITGISVAAFAGSAIIINRVGEYLLSRHIDVLQIFKYMGFSFLPILAITSLLLRNPPSDPDLTPKQPHLKIRALFQDANFWGLLCVMFTGSCIGLMIIGNIKPYGLSLNLDVVIAGTAVSVIALFNVLGRLIWGWIGGLMEGKKVIVISLVSTTVVCLAAPFVVRDTFTFLFFAAVAGFNYASCLVIYAVEIARLYSPERMGSIYSILLIGNGLAGMIAPTTTGRIFDSTGSYLPAFFIFGFLSLIAIFLFWFLYQPKRLKNKTESSLYSEK